MSRKRRNPGVCMCGKATHLRCTICNEPACHHHNTPHPSIGWDSCRSCRSQTREQLVARHKSLSGKEGA